VADRTRNNDGLLNKAIIRSGKEKISHGPTQIENKKLFVLFSHLTSRTRIV
jgi:hypothetical protein